MLLIFSVVKEGTLDSEFENLQEFLHGDKSVDLYSPNRQRAEMRSLINAGYLEQCPEF
ncbi:MAG: hypothetical protein ACOCZP_03985 [Candidatus Hadarchaeota archaeon]